MKPRQALNKAFLKIKPNRKEIESFKANLIKLLDKVDEIEREENQKTHLRDFLRDTYYKENHEINTKDTKDLVIHHDKTNKSDVGVIIEAKRPSNTSEMLTPNNINKKALHELLLYYLRERITEKNLNVKHLIISNVYEWFIFDEHVFEMLFAQNKPLVKQFQDFEAGKKSTDVFYKDIAEPFINDLKKNIEFTFFDIREYENP
ncbi:class I SAM-dependent DNA methyltransferase, partial [archaeon]|nr:class I SAM-dependent DNA methyltransferase [archaeon]